MHPIVEGFLERPLIQRIGAVIFILVFISYIFWQYFYSGKVEEATQLKEKIESLNASILQEQRVARNLEKFRREVKDLEAKLTLALRELPDKREIPDLLASISSLARDAGLEVNLFKPNPESYKDFYVEVPVSIAVEGTYHQVATFFDEVGRLPRIVNINQIAVQSPRDEEDKVIIKSQCVATTFRYLDDEERETLAKSAEATPNRRRRRS